MIDDALVGERTQDHLRVRERAGTNALTALQLERVYRATIATRRREVDGHEVTGERALARTVEPPVRMPPEESASKRELVALEGEERTLDLVLG